MEPSFTVVLGPPPDGTAKNLFDTYQQSRKSGDALKGNNWETFEKENANRLFEHEDENPSVMEVLFYEVYKSPIKFVDYFFGMGYHRGFWVATITIEVSHVLVSKKSITWPPRTADLEIVRQSLIQILRRNWVGLFSAHPVAE